MNQGFLRSHWKHEHMYCSKARLFCHKHNHLTQNVITLGCNLYPQSQFINQRERESKTEERERERGYLPTNTSSSWKRNQGFSVSKQKSPYFTKSVWKKNWNQWVENLALSVRSLRFGVLVYEFTSIAFLQWHCVRWDLFHTAFLSLSLSFLTLAFPLFPVKAAFGNKFPDVVP